jgi:hypothetical protein
MYVITINVIQSDGAKFEIVNSNFTRNIEILSYITKFVVLKLWSLLRHRKFLYEQIFCVPILM